MIYHAGEATFLEDEDYNTLVRLTRLALPADSPADDRFVNAYWTTRVVDSMRRTGHGGIVLLVPSGSSDWRDALSDAPKYQCSPPFRGLRDALDRLLPNPYAVNALVESEHLQNAADAVGQVTAVDGATVLDMDLRLHAFGAMIQSGQVSVGDIMCVEAGRAKAGGVLRSIRELGGARPRAAAEICCRIRESDALVASRMEACGVRRLGGTESGGASPWSATSDGGRRRTRLACATRGNGARQRPGLRRQSRHPGIHSEGVQVRISSPGNRSRVHISEASMTSPRMHQGIQSRCPPREGDPLLGRAVPPARKPPAHRPAWMRRPAGERQVYVSRLWGDRDPWRRGGRGVVLADSRSASPASGPPTEPQCRLVLRRRHGRTFSPPEGGTAHAGFRARRG
jgi:hypothetical protein